MAINAVPAVIPVAEFDTACDWYASFFGRPADQRPMDSLAEWHLIDAGIVQVFHDRGNAGRTTVNRPASRTGPRLDLSSDSEVAKESRRSPSSVRQRHQHGPGETVFDPPRSRCFPRSHRLGRQGPGHHHPRNLSGRDNAGGRPFTKEVLHVHYPSRSTSLNRPT